MVIAPDSPAGWRRVSGSGLHAVQGARLPHAADVILNPDTGLDRPFMDGREMSMGQSSRINKWFGYEEVSVTV